MKEDEDFVVYESRAIGKYIEAKYPGLAPAKSDLRAYGHYEQALSTEVANFDHFATIALAEKMFKPYASRSSLYDKRQCVLTSFKQDEETRHQRSCS